MSALNPQRRHFVRHAGFTLVELLVVMTIIILMVGLGVSAFKGGASTGAMKAASVVAAGEFDSARNEAIMRQTSSRVIIDTAYVTGRGDLADHYLRRMTVAYLNPQGVDASNPPVPVTTSGLPVDPSNKVNWLQSGAWTVLPGNTYFDINYSVLHGTGMKITFAGPNVPPDATYAYYQFDPTGQTLSQTSSPFYVVTPTGSTPISAIPAQCVISSGLINSVTGTFQEKGQQSATSTAPGTCYGFVLFRMGHMTFFHDNSEIQQPTS